MSSRVHAINAATTSALIHTPLPSLLDGKIATPDGGSVFDEFRKADDVLRVDEWSQGLSVRKAYRRPIQKAKSSVIAVRDEQGIVALATVVGPGLAVTKASVLPAEPRCELATGEVLEADVLGVEPAFDVALLSLAALDLEPVRWSDEAVGTPGTFVAIPGLQDLPLAVGVVSVGTRNLKGPYPTSVKPLPRERATMPEVIGSAVQGRGYWIEFVDGRAADAGIRPGDVLLTVAGHPVRSHEDLAKCVVGRWAGEAVNVELLRAGGRHEVTLYLRANGQLPFSHRRDRFPTVFEHDAPLLVHECGGPVLDLRGNALGITIARVGPHGCMAIPADRIQNLLPDLKSGKLADIWKGYRQELLNRDSTASAQESSEPAKPVDVTVDELKEDLRFRRDRFKSLLVEYEVVSKPHVGPQLLMAWNMQLVRDYREYHRIGFSGEKRLSEVKAPSLLMWNAPKDRVAPDQNAPPSVAQAVEQQRLEAESRRQEGRTDHLFRRMRGEQRSQYLFDGTRSFRWDKLRRQMVATPTSRFHLADMYLSGLGLRPLDPEPAAERRRVQQQFAFPDNFELYDRCRVLPTYDSVDDASCIVIEAVRQGEEDGEKVERLDQIWLDPKVGSAPRRWEQRTNGVLTQVRTNSEFMEWAPECWLPWESTWTFYTPEWAASEHRNRPAYTFNMQLRRAKVNDVADEHFRP